MNIQQMADEANELVRKYINRSAGQHLKEIRLGFQELIDKLPPEPAPDPMWAYQQSLMNAEPQMAYRRLAAILDGGASMFGNSCQCQCNCCNRNPYSIFGF